MFALLVVAGAEVGVLGFGVGQQGVEMTSWVLLSGALGFLLGHPVDQPAVLGAEEGLGAAGVDGGLAEGGAEVGVAAAGGVAAFALAAGRRFRTCGGRRAQEHRCPAVGKTVMSTPISPMMSWAVMTPKPGMASSWAIWCSYGSHSTAIFSSSSLDLGGEWSMLREHHLQDEGVLLGVKNEQSSASPSWADLPRIRVRAIWARAWGCVPRR